MKTSILQSCLRAVAAWMNLSKRLAVAIAAAFMLLSGIVAMPESAQAYPFWAQENYEAPREATGRIVCANCHLAEKPINVEVPQSVKPDSVFKAVVEVPYDLDTQQVLGDGSKGGLNVGAVLMLPEGFKLAPPDRIPEELKEEVGSTYFLPYSEEQENILLVGFDQDSLKYLTTKNLGEIAEARNQDPVETIIDLIVANDGDIQTVFFLMSEENVRKKVRLPYMSFGSDAGSIAAEGKVLEDHTHPRAYGTFTRVLGKYVRDEGLLSLEDAIYKMSYLAAQKLKIKERGKLEPGYYADVVIFDPATVADRATFEKPHQYSEGIIHVFVNGEAVIKDGDHTGATPGRFVKGPGYRMK